MTYAGRKKGLRNHYPRLGVGGVSEAPVHRSIYPSLYPPQNKPLNEPGHNEGFWLRVLGDEVEVKDKHGILSNKCPLLQIIPCIGIVDRFERMLLSEPEMESEFPVKHSRKRVTAKKRKGRK
jgi:hypothetical protein